MRTEGWNETDMRRETDFVRRKIGTGSSKVSKRSRVEFVVKRQRLEVRTRLGTKGESIVCHRKSVVNSVKCVNTNTN